MKNRITDQSFESDESVEFIQAETLVTIPPDGGYGWVIVFSAWLCNFLVGFVSFSYGILLQPICLDMKLNDHIVSVSMSIMAGCFNFAAIEISLPLIGPFGSVLVNRFGFRIVSLIGTGVCGISLLIMSELHNIHFIYVAHGLFAGTGLGLMYLPSLIAVGFYFEKRRAVATSFSTSGAGVGVMVCQPFLTVTLGDTPDTWRVCVKSIAAIVLILGLIIGLLLKPLKPTMVLTSIIPNMALTTLSMSGESVSTKKKFLCCCGRTNEHFQTANQLMNNTPSKNTISLKMDPYSPTSIVQT